MAVEMREICFFFTQAISMYANEKARKWCSFAKWRLFIQNNLTYGNSRGIEFEVHLVPLARDQFKAYGPYDLNTILILIMFFLLHILWLRFEPENDSHLIE